MTIGGVNGSNPPAPRPATNGDNIVALQQQKKTLQDEIKRVKANDKLAPEAKKKQLAVLQKKLEEIENAIRASAKQKTDTGTTKATAAKATDSSTPDDLKLILQNQKTEREDAQARARKRKFGETGLLLDIYA